MCPYLRFWPLYSAIARSSNDKISGPCNNYEVLYRSDWTGNTVSCFHRSLERILVDDREPSSPLFGKLTAEDYKFALIEYSGNCKPESDTCLEFWAETQTWYSCAMRQFGNVFWECVGSLAPHMPEVDDFALQVGTMWIVLMDAQVLCSKRMTNVGSCNQDNVLGSLFLATIAEDSYLDLSKRVLRVFDSGTRNTN